MSKEQRYQTTIHINERFRKPIEDYNIKLVNIINPALEQEINRLDKIGYVPPVAEVKEPKWKLFRVGDKVKYQYKSKSGVAVIISSEKYKATNHKVYTLNNGIKRFSHQLKHL